MILNIGFANNKDSWFGLLSNIKLFKKRMSESPKREEGNGNGLHNGDHRHNSEDRRSREGHHDNRDKDPNSYTQVYVAKLHRRTREEDLREAFSRFGNIKDVVLKHSYAFIDFGDHVAATAAVKEMDGKAFVNGEELVVE
jgi:RNA recognition motif-containing protein